MASDLAEKTGQCEDPTVGNECPTPIVERDRNFGVEIGFQQIRFPSVEVGLPENYENASSISDLDMLLKFFKDINMLQQPFEEILQEQRPDCVVADMFFPWATDVAGKFGIPRIVFHGSSFFSLCVQDSLSRYKPHANIASDLEAFVVPCVPDQIEMTSSKLPDDLQDPKNIGELHKSIWNSDERCYGTLMNSFYELEPAYAEHYRKAMGRKVWHIGPVSFSNMDFTEKAQKRGNRAAIDEHECLRWLDSKEPNSVLFVCFGSMPRFNSTQLREIAMGLEDSGHPFI
ncbi:scopoletin glucosyltransferase-like [Telopea speciosissima]|uniref:scopoletin glucosyltransferase-like n=1 Tax=Telopea speciosissima TaxID=54955 RepID=UPI001CC5E573|nr:scopoletin glucosyltransferase-like [Telopea speciosissima]